MAGIEYGTKDVVLVTLQLEERVFGTKLKIRGPRAERNFRIA